VPSLSLPASPIKCVKKTVFTTLLLPIILCLSSWEKGRQEKERRSPHSTYYGDGEHLPGGRYGREAGRLSHCTRLSCLCLFLSLLTCGEERRRRALFAMPPYSCARGREKEEGRNMLPSLHACLLWRRCLRRRNTLGGRTLLDSGLVLFLRFLGLGRRKRKGGRRHMEERKDDGK